ncbi:MAG TPA: hypothetical protein VFN77_03750 [Acetobacteraceae bacterium]|nr:hypothetical protein [Acetobacteraceae bacterium]
MRRKKSAAWSWPATAALAWQGARMTADAQLVIAMRLAKLGRNNAAARREAVLMVSEKAAALARAQAIAMKAAGTGKRKQAARQIMGLYGRKVAANRRRLAKG